MSPTVTFRTKRGLVVKLGHPRYARMLRALLPLWDKVAHTKLAQNYLARAGAHDALVIWLRELACLETFGRPFEFTDYKVSAIGRDEFSEERKNQIRYHAHTATDLRELARAHAWCARYPLKRGLVAPGGPTVVS